MIPIERAHLLVAAATHPGMKGKNNEDRYAVSAHLISERRRVPALLAIIADGVGGHRAGEVAAEMAVEMICQLVADSDASEPVATLHKAIVETSQAIYAKALAEPDKQGMSSTCVCAWVIGDQLFIASVGDSRIYLIRGDAISQLTTDHTWVQEAIETGALTQEQARNHPNAHVIRRHLGSQQQVVPDFRLRFNPDESDMEAEANQGARLLTGDRLLLCSDGLTDLVGDGEILEVMASLPLEEGLSRLVDLANARGGHDNITAIGLQVPDHEVVAAGDMRKAKNTRLRKLVWILLGLFAVAAGLAGGFFWMQSNFGLAATQTPTLAPLIQPTFNPPEVIVPMATPMITITSPASATASASPSPTVTVGPTGVRPTYTPWPTSTQAPLFDQEPQAP